MGTLYFAYGSNLNRQQMEWRCPDARLVGPLMLPGFKLAFRGYADLEFAEGESAPGAAWEITPKCERKLDIYEGVKSGLYFKHYVPVSVSRDGERVVEDMLVYIMGQGRRLRHPDRWYYEAIADGYRDCGLAEHLPMLEAARNACPDWKGDWPKPKPYKWDAKRYKAKASAYVWDKKLGEWVLKTARPAKGAHKARKSDDERAPWTPVPRPYEADGDAAARAYEQWLRDSAEGRGSEY